MNYSTQPSLILSLILFLGAGVLQAQTLSYTGNYTENFNSSITTTPNGWFVYVDPVGAKSTGLLNGNTQAANNLNAFTYGLSGDRAIGLYSNTSNGVRYIQLNLRNDSGSAINKLSISYDLELWGATRDFTQRRQGGFVMEFSTDNTNWSLMGGNFTTVQTNDSVTSTSNPYWLNTAITQSVVGQQYTLTTAVAVNNLFYLRWNGSGLLVPDLIPENSGSQNHHMASFIDNVQITTVIPEPKTYAMILALSTLAFAAWKRKRRAS